MNKNLLDRIKMPCPRHGVKYAKVLNGEKLRVIVCWAKTPGELTERCWWHLSGHQPNGKKVCIKCKVNPRIDTYSYCYECKAELSRKSKIKCRERKRVSAG